MCESSPPGRLVSQGQPLLSLINTSPYEAGWLVKIEISDPAELANLMRVGTPEFEEYLADEHLKYPGN